MHPPAASAKWISPFPAMTKRLEEASASPKPSGHEGGPSPTGNSYFSVTAPSPGTRPDPVRAAHSPPGRGEQAPRFESNLSSAVRASSPVANPELPVVAAAPAAPSRTPSPAKTTTVRSHEDAARSSLTPRPRGGSGHLVVSAAVGALPVADHARSPMAGWLVLQRRHVG